MFVKRFIASDMQDAVKKIKKEFGSDAIILDSKTVRAKGLAGLFKKNLEVVAAYEPKRRLDTASADRATSRPAPAAASAAAAPPQSSASGGFAPIVQTESEPNAQIAPLAAQIESLKGLVTDLSNRIYAAPRESAPAFPPDIQKLYEAMVEREVGEGIAREIAALTHSASLRESVDSRLVAQQLVMDRLGQPSPIKLKKYAQTVLLFAGPTGAGKTTTLVKLAGRLALDQNLSVGLVNMDTYRVGAMEHMRIYADIMDIPLKTAYTAKDLKEAVDAMPDRDVILIDTAGRSAIDPAYKTELEAFITAANVDEVYVVLSISTGSKVCQQILRNYAFIPNFKLIVTKLDEVGAWGNILNIADYAKKPLSYITAGQNVPDDISQVDPAKLADNIVGRQNAL